MSDQQPLDPRQQLAKMEAEIEAARKKAEELEKANTAKRDELLKQLRADDLADVIAKCKMHSFTPTDLRGALKTKGTSTKSTPRKSTKSRSSTRKKAT
jgi:hypothetical protein